MAIDLVATLDRLVAIEKEAFASLSTPVAVDAVPYMIHQQEDFPYITHRVGDIEIDPDSQNIDVWTVTFTVQLVIGHIQDGYRGQPEGMLYAYLPTVIKTFNQRKRLQSAAYPIAQVGLVEAVAHGPASRGLVVGENTGVQARPVGSQIRVVCTYADEITQDYL